MAEVTHGQVNLNTVLGAIGTAGTIAPGLFRGITNMVGGGDYPGNCGCNGNGTPVNRYEMGLIQENAALKTQVEMHKAEIYTDNKIEAQGEKFGAMIEKRDEKYECRFRSIENRLAEQAVFNERTSAAVGCVAQQANNMQVLLNSITKTVIPNGAVCPGWGNVTVTPATTPTTTG